MDDINNEYNSLIFGKSSLERIVSCEITDNTTELFIEEKDGTIRSEFKPNKYWILSPINRDKYFHRMLGDLHYRYIKIYDTREECFADKKKFKQNKADIFTIFDEKEAAMVMFGFTYFKGMKLNEVSVLSFDIESTTLKHTEEAKVLLISNTFRKNGVVVRKLFSYDDYETEAELFDAWCNWVREVNPSIFLGYNIYSFDIPYLNFCAEKAGTTLKLGRNGSDITFAPFDTDYRKDGSQSYTYRKAYVYGREIIDVFFLAIKYDFARQYESYRLKAIIDYEKLEVKNRQHYDASTIRVNYLIPEEWKKIKVYAEHDADDALALFDLMVPAYFYLNQSIPKTFSQIINSASGSQINAFLLRSYLQDFHSIPSTTQVNSFGGGISFGNPGIYKNVFKVDVSSLYPSIIMQYEIYDRQKDPYGNFLNMVTYFTNQRLEYKKKGKETGDRYYKDLDQASKIVVNSSYGVMGTPGLQFNSPDNASLITETGRAILAKSIEWATGTPYVKKEEELDNIPSEEL